MSEQRYFHYQANDGTTYRFPEPLLGSNTPDGETLHADGNWYPGRDGLAATVYFSGDFTPVNEEDVMAGAKHVRSADAKRASDAEKES